MQVQRDFLQRVLPYRPFTSWIGELKDWSILRADLVAGVTVGMVIIPQSMANAKLAGLPAVYGLYAAFLPPAIGALFGCSRQLSTGPVALASLISAASVSVLTPPGSSHFISYSILLALMVGVIRLSIGALRLGILVNLLSSPVVVGFTNAGALIIAASQMHHAFGVDVERGEYFYQAAYRVLDAAARGPDWETVSMAALAGALLIGLRYVRSGRLPYVLIAAAATTFVSWLIGYRGALVGEIPRGLPSFQSPEIDLTVVPDLAMGAILITLVGFMEAMAIAKTIATRTKQQIDINQELIGQGMANLVGSFFQSYVVSGSFARSGVNYSSGARTGFASVVTSAVVVATLLWLTPLLYYLPQATLAMIIITSVAYLIHVKPIIAAWRVQKQDGIIAIVTFVCTVGLAPALHKGIFIGVALSLITDLYRTMRPRIKCLTRLPDGSLHESDTDELRPEDEVAIMRFDGRLYFGDSSYFEDKVLEVVARMPKLRYLVIDSAGINRVDATGEQALRNLIERLRDIGIDVFFTGAKRQFRNVLERTGCMDYIGSDHFFSWNQQALEFLSRRGDPRI